MWRADMAGEFYTYLPPSAAAQNQHICSMAPFSTCNDVYGASTARGSFTFPIGRRTYLAIRLKLNTIGKADGEMELFVNGVSTILVTKSNSISMAVDPEAY